MGTSDVNHCNNNTRRSAAHMKKIFNLANETLHVCMCACVSIGCERRAGEKEMMSTEGATETEDRGGQP